MKLKKVLVIAITILLLFPLCVNAQAPETTSQAVILMDGETRKSII